MKVADIQKFFPDLDVREVITAGKNGEVSESDFAPNLLRSLRREQAKNDVTIAELYLKQLTEHYGKPDCNWAERVMYKFATEWEKNPNALSKKTEEACWAILRPHQRDIKRHLDRQKGIFEAADVVASSATKTEETAVKFDDFPGEECSLNPVGYQFRSPASVRSLRFRDF